MQHNNSKHTRNVFFSTLLLFVMLMAGASSASAATERKPQLQLVSTKYTSSGTEVTLRLWMFNSKGNTAHYEDNVWLDIDDNTIIYTQRSVERHIQCKKGIGYA